MYSLPLWSSCFSVYIGGTSRAVRRHQHRTLKLGELNASAQHKGAVGCVLMSSTLFGGASTSRHFEEGGSPYVLLLYCKTTLPSKHSALYSNFFETLGRVFC
ncbi:unnamed protein product [Discosporangium mesarthrocarpum]